jgi:ketosteroid isomerase-like protein
MNDRNYNVKEGIQNFANALNAGDLGSILSFYSEEGIFMPEGFKTLSKNSIGKKRAKLLEELNFKIQFEVVKIVVNDNYAFVEALAKTSENDKNAHSTSEKTSRDFFVLRKEDDQWKILRYIFNNVQALIS